MDAVVILSKESAPRISRPAESSSSSRDGWLFVSLLCVSTDWIPTSGSAIQYRSITQYPRNYLFNNSTEEEEEEEEVGKLLTYNPSNNWSSECCCSNIEIFQIPGAAEERMNCSIYQWQRVHKVSFPRSIRARSRRMKELAQHQLPTNNETCSFYISPVVSWFFLLRPNDPPSIPPTTVTPIEALPSLSTLFPFLDTQEKKGQDLIKRNLCLPTFKWFFFIFQQANRPFVKGPLWFTTADRRRSTFAREHTATAAKCARTILSSSTARRRMPWCRLPIVLLRINGICPSIWRSTTDTSSPSPRTASCSSSPFAATSPS